MIRAVPPLPPLLARPAAGRAGVPAPPDDVPAVAADAPAPAAAAPVEVVSPALPFEAFLSGAVPVAGAPRSAAAVLPGDDAPPAAELAFGFD
ncbi:hypothetical protein SAHL_14665 [Salinisphaera orenii YIM 95161]|uniref:Uncharacterized protein n=2 Tax=Salinisphaera TaxID=180541 RepID=A0A423PIB7_9GAMM|nr:hypothetical protein SAHL_14665 [Salinisphaera halophila YIM 95161]